MSDSAAEAMVETIKTAWELGYRTGLEKAKESAKFSRPRVPLLDWFAGAALEARHLNFTSPVACYDFAESMLAESERRIAKEEKATK